MGKKAKAAAGFERYQIEDFRITREPFYLPISNEVELFEAAYQKQIPVLLKGPTGCGKTRFIQHMAARLGRPVYTVACHDDLAAADVVEIEPPPRDGVDRARHAREIVPAPEAGAALRRAGTAGGHP